ncbi:MAG: helix-turn-helix transcriptional regulator [Christensenellaceae bacterium]|nr:helix-turn-helix transcriptional regulator [Christensenellaceae bacterium]
MKIVEAVARRTRYLLNEKKMSQYRLERNMAIPHNTMTNIMQTRGSAVNFKTVFQICRGLNISLAEFVSDPIFESEDLEID